ncbi:MAG: response regulator transcription factor [Proteobacteria bacterium]|nr:response regulator transcription factor [Pseudomonadota bacterium]
MSNPHTVVDATSGPMLGLLRPGTGDARALRSMQVVLIEEPGILRDGLCALLQSVGANVVAVASSPREALQALAQFKPQVVILDFAPALKTSPATIRQFKRRWPELRALLLTLRRDSALIESAVAAGADGYLHKNETRAELIAALQRLQAGKRYLRARAAERTAEAAGSAMHDGRDEPVSRLTSREQEVIALIARGFRTREMAKLLSLSAKTIEKHRTNLMRKLGLHSAAAVAAYAIRHGLV